MKGSLKIDKQSIYIFIVVLVVVFSLFFLNYFFDISSSSFTVKTGNSENFENKITGDYKGIDDMDENFQKYFNK